jgi:hypothetical protein
MRTALLIQSTSCSLSAVAQSAQLFLDCPVCKVGDTIATSFNAAVLGYAPEESYALIDKTKKASFVFNLTSPTEVNLTKGEEQLTLLLHPDDALIATISEKPSLKNMQFTGKGSETATLYTNFQKQFGTFTEQAVGQHIGYMTLDAAAYAKNRDSVRTAQQQFLQSASTSYPAALQHLQAQVTYSTLFDKLHYPTMNKLYSTMNGLPPDTTWDAVTYSHFADTLLIV